MCRPTDTTYMHSNWDLLNIFVELFKCDVCDKNIVKYLIFTFIGKWNFDINSEEHWKEINKLYNVLSWYLFQIENVRMLVLLLVLLPPLTSHTEIPVHGLRHKAFPLSQEPVRPRLSSLVANSNSSNYCSSSVTKWTEILLSSDLVQILNIFNRN